MTSTRQRPRVICHMLTSIDGRIVVTEWPISPEARRQYEVVHAKYDADAWMCGRVTMEPFAKRLRSDAEVANQHLEDGFRADFRAPGDYESFAFAVDPIGRLAWESNDIEGDHVVAVLSQRVSDDYLAFLRQREVSYLLAGDHEIDLALAFEKIATTYNVETLMLEGGGKINGAVLKAGLIDEISVLVAPIVDGRIGSPAVFDVDVGHVTAHKVKLEWLEQLADGVVWLRYHVDHQ